MKREAKVKDIINKIISEQSIKVVLDEPYYDYSLSTTRIKENLYKLMGTDVISLMDKRFSDKLKRKMQEEYELNMDKKERELAEAEIQRLRKLRLEGLIPTQKKKVKIGGRKTRKKKRVQKSKDSDDQTVKSVSRFKTCKTEDHSKKEIKKQDQEVVTQVQMTKRYESKPGSANIEYILQKEKGENSQEQVIRKPKTSQPQRRGKYSLREPPLLQMFRKEETVTGMYNLAEQLVVFEPKRAH